MTIFFRKRKSRAGEKPRAQQRQKALSKEGKEKEGRGIPEEKRVLSAIFTETLGKKKP